MPCATSAIAAWGEELEDHPFDLLYQLDFAVTVNVADPPLKRFTAAAMLPAPLAGQLEPAVAEQVQVAAVSCGGNTSLTVAPVTALGPAFDAMIV